MQDDEDSGEFVSKSARKRAADAAQALGTRLTELKDSELQALDLPEKLLDAILLARRITSRGGLARQRQYIGRLMRDIDTAPIESATTRRACAFRHRAPTRAPSGRGRPRWARCRCRA